MLMKPRARILHIGIITTLLIVVLMMTGTVHAASIADSRNATFNPANTILDTGANQDIGWVYVSATSYSLTRIEARFDGFTDFNTTVEFYQGTPATGLTLLASEGFNVDGGGNWSGDNFTTPVNVVAGTTYFVGFRNTRRTPTTNNGGATVLQSYSSTTPSNYANAGNAATNNARRPILRFWTQVAPVANNNTYNVNENATLNVNTATGVLANDTDADGDTLTAAVVTGPANGTLNLNTNGSFTYTPNLNYNGTDTFTYRANDGAANSNNATVTITINPVNSAPVVANNTYAGTEDTMLTVAAPGVLGNDSDPEGSAITAAVVTNPTKGTLALNADGSFTYTPNANTNGADTFTYRASDGALNSTNATVTLNIAAVNDAPVAANNTYTVAEDNLLNVNTANGVLNNDTDDGAITAVLVTGPTNGTLTLNANGSFTYNSNDNFNGTDSFTYRASDGTLQSNVATVTITVTAVNDAPVAGNNNYTAIEDTPLVVAAPGILGNDSDAEGSPLTINITNNVDDGTLVLNADGSFTYTSDPNEDGSDSFSYRVSDGTTWSNTATVNIGITAVNDAPIASNNTFNVNEDTTLNVNIFNSILNNDDDVDDFFLDAVLVTGPTKGTLTLNDNGSFTYIPNANTNGADTFTYQADDGNLLSNIATVTINVTPINDAPVAVANTYTTDEDTPLTVTAPGVLGNDTDPDGNTLTAALVTNVTKGTLALAANGSFTYTPNANTNGNDSFTYRANDGTVNSGTVTVTITVNPVNDAPVAVNNTYAATEDTALTIAAPGILANDSDQEGNALTAVLVTGPANGTLTLNADGSFTYTPGANFAGTDSFTYSANDGTSNSNAATVTITVAGVNDAPVAVDDAYAANEDAPLTIAAAAGVVLNDTDVDSNPLTAVLVAGPTNGSLTLNADGSFTYTPVANYNGADSFTYQANDSFLNSNTATVNITVNPVNDAPVATDDAYTTAEDTPLTIAAVGVLGNDIDLDTLTLNAVLVGNPVNGLVVLNPDGSFTYTPDANFNGADSFTYQANDGFLNSNTVTVAITVTAVNDAPVTANDAYTANEDTALTIPAAGVLGNDTDPETNALTAILITGPANGTLTLNADGSFTYTPVANFNGADSFTYQANDGALNSNTATVNITVNNVNDAPVAVADTYAINEDTALTVAAAGILTNDTDLDANPLTAVLVTGPASGTLTLNPNGAFTYTPSLNFNGADSFTSTLR